MPDQGCAHIDAIKSVKQPKRGECEECVKIRSRWVRHPVIASAEPGERWLYCYPDDEFAAY